jgi:fructose-bisphosphate aldolase class I
MALPGKESGTELDPSAIARETVRALKAAVPKDVGGVVFLSGGQTPKQATENLNAIAHATVPWPVTFSYSRALEEPVLEAWQGNDANVEEAQKTFLHRLSLNVAARQATYRKEME